VSRRVREQERRREERVRAEQEAGKSERRARWIHVLGPLAIGGLALAAVTYAGVRSTRTDKSPSASPASTAAPFAQNYAGLVPRRKAAHVPTMMQTMGSRAHFHPQLKVYVDGRRMEVPPNIGIDPRVDPMEMAALHTHDPSGTIHVEGMEHATLGQFMAIWGVPLSKHRLGSHRTAGSRGVRMWVDGKPSRAFGALKLADGQRIVISFGPMRGPAPST
jgi:hypothetical protein